MPLPDYKGSMLSPALSVSEGCSQKIGAGEVSHEEERDVIRFTVYARNTRVRAGARVLSHACSRVLVHVFFRVRLYVCSSEI